MRPDPSAPSGKLPPSRTAAGCIGLVLLVTAGWAAAAVCAGLAWRVFAWTAGL